MAVLAGNRWLPGDKAGAVSYKGVSGECAGYEQFHASATARQVAVHPVSRNQSKEARIHGAGSLLHEDTRYKEVQRP